MENSFSNIYDNNRKNKSIISMCLILVFMLITLILFGCESNNIDKDKATIEGFMKCLYEVDNYDIIDKAESLYSVIGEGVTEKNTNSEEESFAIIYNGMDKYMTNKYSSSGNLISSRISPVRSALLAKKGDYLVSINKTKVDETSSSDSVRQYTVVTDITYTFSDGNTKTGEVNALVELEKEDNKWLISSYEENSNTSLNLEMK